MDNCVVCLSTNVEIFSRIHSQSSEWQELRIQRIIEKHLWWWYMKQQSPEDDNSSWICRLCWQELSNFHRFYLKVERVHKQYDFLKWPELKSCLVDKEDNVAAKTMLLFAVKEEFKLAADDSSLQTLKEDLVSLDTIKGKARNNLTLINESIEINELPTIIDVKDEQLLLASSDDDDLWDPILSTEETHTSKSKTEKNKKLLVKVRKTQIPKTKISPNKKINSLAKLEITRKNDEFLAQSEFKLICHLCDIPLKDFLTLKTHYRREHQTPGYALCCNKKFYNRGPLADHLRVHENPNYFKCTICNRILAHRLSYENHLEFHKHANETRERIFRCEKCEKSFFKKAVYDRHILSHVPEEERKFQCDECDKKFAAEYLVTQHKAFAHLNKYGKICDICGRTFRERFSFQRHMAEHNGAPLDKVPCDICGVELTSKYLLNRHKKKMHTEENQQEQICPYCSKVSPNMHAHRQHINYAHTMERKHACNMCEKKFKRPLELKEHLSTHTGEPLYTCPHCPRTFISSANMHKHRKAAHPKEWEESRLKKLNAQKLRELTIKEHFNSTVTANDNGGISRDLQCSQANEGIVI